MKIRTLIVVDREDGSAPVKHEIWQDLPDFETREFQYPEEPFVSPNSPDGYMQWKRYEEQCRRHNNFVETISREVAIALGRALGNKPQ